MNQNSKMIVIWVFVALVVGLGIGYYVGDKRGYDNGVTAGKDAVGGEEAAKAANPFGQKAVNPLDNTSTNPYENVKINPFE